MYSPILCEPIKVVKPALELVKTMPEQVTQRDPIPVKLVVKNSGSSRLTMVKVTDSLPAGLTTDAGQSAASFDAEMLDLGQSKVILLHRQGREDRQLHQPGQGDQRPGRRSNRAGLRQGREAGARHRVHHAAAQGSLLR